MIPCPFSDMDRTNAYAKACVLGNVEALPELRALCKRKAYSYLLGKILFIGLPKYLLLQAVILAQEHLNE